MRIVPLLKSSRRLPVWPADPFWMAVVVGIALLVSASRLAAAPRVYRDKVELHWFANRAQFWYRVEVGENAHEYVLVDAEHGIRRPAFDHAKLAAALSVVEKRPLAASALPLAWLDFEAVPGSVLLGTGSAMWRLELTDSTLHPVADTPPSWPSLTASDSPHPSRTSSIGTQINFENRTGHVVKLFWLDTEGVRQPYGEIGPHARRGQTTFEGHSWLVADQTGRTLAVYQAAARPASALITEPPATRPASQPADAPQAGPEAPKKKGRGGDGGRASPDGKWIAFSRQDDLYLRPVAGGGVVRLSHDGQPRNGYAVDRLWWSPDSRSIFALKTEAGDEHKIYTVESSPKGQVQPTLRTLNYLKPGDKIDHPRPRLFNVATAAAVPVSDDRCQNPWSIGDVKWDPDSSRVTFFYNERGHQVLRMLGVDAATGVVTTLVNEQSDTFIDYSGKYFARRLPGNELIWMSERDGGNHLWLYDTAGGRVKNQITRGLWVVQKVIEVDESARQIWFTAGGVRMSEDPYYTNYCRINFDGTGLRVLTEGDGTHVVQRAKNDRYFIDTWSRVDQPPVIELRESESGKLVCRLEEADATEVLAGRGGRWPQRFVAKGRDGTTDIYGVIFFPRDVDPARKYPVVENIYAGPQDFFTPKAFRPAYGSRQQIADRGMIVVQCDGMGTSGRSKKFHDVCWQNLRDAGFPDRVRWISAAAAKFPQMDLTRVGIYGGSAGGQNAMAALLWHHDFYKVAVADCGCHDNRMDKIWWNEQWMGWPVGPQYAASSNVVNAPLLDGKLLLIFGELDDNVDPASTMQVVNALEKSDKDFELLIIAGARHGAAETPYGSRRRLDFLAKNLLAPTGP